MFKRYPSEDQPIWPETLTKVSAACVKINIIVGIICISRKNFNEALPSSFTRLQVTKSLLSTARAS